MWQCFERVQLNKIGYIIYALLIVSFFYGTLFFIFENVFASNCTTAQDGDWNTTSTWSSCADGIPQANDAVVISHAVTIGDYVIDAVDSITIASGGSLSQNTTQTQVVVGNVLIQNGGTLTHGTNTTTQAYSVNMSIGGNLTIDSGGTIDVSEKGYAAGNGTGAGATASGLNSAGGGAHAGNGGDSSTNYTGGIGYCDIENPTTMGSGGGYVYDTYGAPGQGGGLARLVVSGTATINGVIVANGGNGTSHNTEGTGGGAGGGIFVQAESIAGTPEGISATGGTTADTTRDGGGGGGGCITLLYTTSNTVTYTSVVMYGGTGYDSGEYGGAGVLLIKKSGNDGDIYSINNGTSGAETIQYSSNLTLGTLTFASSSIYTVSSTNALTLTSSTPFDNGDGTGIFKVDGSASVTFPTSITFKNITFELHQGTTLSSSSSLNIVLDASSTLSMYEYTTSTVQSFNSLTMKSGSILTHGANSTAQNHSINLSLGTLDIQSGASVDIDEKGYTLGSGPGAGTGGVAGQSGGGGAHGGNGGASGQSIAGGTAYCDSTDPMTIGSSGGYAWSTSAPPGAGGGLARFTISGDATVAGTITANGGTGSSINGYGAGGGAGGGIYMNVGGLTISGTVQADGAIGANVTQDGGGGGGGCIRIEYATYDDTGATMTAAGGIDATSNATDGSSGSISLVALAPTAPTTVYTHTTNAQSGDSDPTNIATLTPVFSGICNTVSGTCSNVGIQVDNDSDFSSPLWDSGSIDIVDIADTERSEDIVYAGTGLDYNQTYYVRIRFYNNIGAGSWSDGTDTFYIPRAIELHTLNYGGTITAGNTASIVWSSFGGGDDETVKIEYSTDNFVSDVNTIVASATSTTNTSTAYTYTWTVPNISSNSVKIKITSNNDTDFSVTSEQTFSISSSGDVGQVFGRTISNSNFYTSSSTLSSLISNSAISKTGSTFLARREVSVQNAGSELTNHSVRVDVTYDADMQTDFDDIRFYASDGTTSLDFWLQEKVDSTSAIYWVEVPTLATGTSTVYMYYGNSGLSSGSVNSSSTMLFADNFDGASLSTGWTEVTSGGASAGTFSSGQWTKTCNGECDWWNSSSLDAGAYISFPLVSSADTTWEAITKMISHTGPTLRDMGIMLYNSATNGYMWGVNSDVQKYEVALTGTANLCLVDSNTVPVYLKIRKTTSNGVSSANSFTFFYSTDGATWSQCGSYTASATMSSVGLFIKDWDTGTTAATFDFFYVRGYAASEPTVTVQAEETLSSEVSLYSNMGDAFTQISSFSASTTGAGDVTFQISDDGGSTWYYCSADTLTQATNVIADSSTVLQITDACLSQLSSGTFAVRSWLSSSGADTVATLASYSYLLNNNHAPSISMGVPVQNSAQQYVTVTTTIADSDLDAGLSLTVEHSTDGTTWASSTIYSVSYTDDTGGTFTTSTGLIASIDTDIDGSVDMSIVWNAGTDLADTDDVSVYMRLSVADSQETAIVSSTAFALDTQVPSAPGALTVSTTSTASIIFAYGATSTDSNFSYYTIAWNAGTTPPQWGSAEGETTTSTYSALADVHFNNDTTITIAGLATSTQYTFNIFAVDAYGNYASSTNAVTLFTHADIPGIPTISQATTSTVTISLDAASNPSATTYAVYNVTDSMYVDSDGSARVSAVYQTAAAWENTMVVDLSPNTAYTFYAIAKNGDNVVTSASDVSSNVYTLADIPTSVSTANVTQTAVTVSWNAHNNSSGTTYVVQDTTDASITSGSITEVTYTFTGLTCATTYAFKVKAINDDAISTDFTDAVSVTTSACTVVVEDPAGAPGVAPTISLPAPSVEAMVPVQIDVVDVMTSGDVISAPIISTTMSGGQSFGFVVGAQNHRLTMNHLYEGRAHFTLHSHPIDFDLAPGEEKIFDLDDDGTYDVHVSMPAEIRDTAQVKVTVLDQLPVVVAHNMSYTIHNLVEVQIGNIPQVSFVAISEDPSFMGVSYETYRVGVPYFFVLSEQLGIKKLYIKVKTSAGASATIEDSIRLVSAGYTGQCALTPGSAYKSSASNAVYYITEDCQRRVFTNSDRYFSYFTSWNAVKTVAKSILESIEIDPRGIMPWGPLYDPQYGALVKTLDDPKVYLLLNTEKYWITSEDVFNNLNYQWDWIEDVSEELLANYTNGSEITYTDHHPNYTLIKYKHDPKVYRLEPSSTDTTKQVKRHVANETSFEQLKFRWDRIVTIPDTEVYEDGDVLK